MNKSQILRPATSRKRISAGLFASPVEADDAALRIEHHHQSPHGMENRRDHVALFLQRLFGPLQLSDIKADAVNEPGLAVLLADHFGFAMKPDDAGRRAPPRDRPSAAACR